MTTANVKPQRVDKTISDRYFKHDIEYLCQLAIPEWACEYINSKVSEEYVLQATERNAWLGVLVVLI